MKAFFAVDDAVDKDSHPTACPDQMEKSVNLVDFQSRVQVDTFLIY